jgi:hypothetical protein
MLNQAGQQSRSPRLTLVSHFTPHVSRFLSEMPGLLTRWLREGKRNHRRCGSGPITGFIEDSERLIEEVCRAAQRDVDFLESLHPSSFLIEGLKTAMMVVHDRLLRF